MEEEYNFFSGYSKLNFKKNFNWKLVIALFCFATVIVGILTGSVLWGFLTGTLLAIVIPLGIALSKTPKVTTYLIDGKEYLLYNEYLFFEYAFGVSLRNPFAVDEMNFKPDEVHFIVPFLFDFIKAIKNQKPSRHQYFTAFQKIDIDDIDYVYQMRKTPKSDLKEFFNLIRGFKNIDEWQADKAVDALTTFTEMSMQDTRRQDAHKIDVFTNKVYESMSSGNDSAAAMGYDLKKYRKFLED